MKKPDEKIIPVRVSADLHQQIAAMSQQTEHSSQDIMRLAMRIGLADLRSAGSDLAAIVRSVCQDEGVSFQQWAALQKNPPQSAKANHEDDDTTCPITPATSAASTNTSHAQTPVLARATIVKLPPPPVVATALHWSLNESQTSPAVPESRKEIRYPKKLRKA